MLTLKNLGYMIDDKTIIADQNINIKKQDHLLLLGASGCGKTTLMNIMAGLLRQNTGDIAFENQNYTSLNDHALDTLRAENFGFVFQKLHLIGHLSVAENIALALNKTDKKRVHTLINDLGLSGKDKQKARDLSAGEAQRVAIARAVANSPKVIFADEPTSSLDDINTKTVMDLLFAQAKKSKATLVVSTHDARIKKQFKTILEMSA